MALPARAKQGPADYGGAPPEGSREPDPGAGPGLPPQREDPAGTLGARGSPFQAPSSQADGV